HRRGGNGVAAAETPEAGELADGAGMNRLAVEKAGQLVGQLLLASVALRRLLLQALEADRLEVFGNVLVEQPGAERLGFDYLADGFEGRSGTERRPAGEQFVEDCAGGIEIAPGADLIDLAGGLLGGHVAGRANDR